MFTALARPHLEALYAHAAQDYLRGLTLEHFRETRPQATQREISVGSFAVLKVHRPDVHYFNEMIVQYQLPRRAKIRQVVPDNMVVLSAQPIEAEGSYDVPLQPVGPFWVLEYVSKSSKRKDYNDSFLKYERELKVPYYLVFYPETLDMTLYRRGSKRYVSVKPNRAGRVAIPELELELALLDGWVRYWYRGELIPLPAELQRDLDTTRQQLKQMQEQNERLLAQLRALGIEPKL